jgi:hypothetical protein
MTVEELRAVAAAAQAVRQAGDLALRGGLEIGDLWEQVEAADDLTRRALGEWVAAESRSESRLSPAALGAVAALATALRGGRAARRTQLRRLDDGKLTTALPLWVGTLADVDDLLPPVAGLFDLVVLDEAS